MWGTSCRRKKMVPRRFILLWMLFPNIRVNCFGQFLHPVLNVAARIWRKVDNF